MITYKRDYDKSYDTPIKTLLRNHNALFSNNTESDCIHLYATGPKGLSGALTVHYFWNWAGISDFYYEETDVLKSLVQKACHYYKDKAKGIKFFTPSKAHYEAFQKAGFKKVNTFTYQDGTSFYFADLQDLDDEARDVKDVSLHREAKGPFQSVVGKHMAMYKEAYDIKDPVGAFDVVAFSDGECIGGIQCDAYEDSLYIGRIAVDKPYRKHRIGTELMTRAIDYARSAGMKSINLGTCEFQGRAFYETLGFKVIHTREDNPAGFKSFTMVKEL